MILEEEHDIHTKDGKRFFWMIFSFFAFITLVLGTFVTIATSTHRGVVTDNAYQKGLDYNQVVAADDAQTKLGWSGEISYDRGALSYTLLNEFNKPIVGARVIAYFSYVGADGFDFHIPLHAAGDRYEAQAILKQAGQWDIRIAATWQDTPYQQRTRITVK